MTTVLEMLTTIPFWVAVLRVATPLIFGTLGVLLCERAGVLVGADSMSRQIGVPSYLADVVVASALLVVLVAAMLTRYRLRFDLRAGASA